MKVLKMHHHSEICMSYKILCFLQSHCNISDTLFIHDSDAHHKCIVILGTALHWR